MELEPQRNSEKAGNDCAERRQMKVPAKHHVISSPGHRGAKRSEYVCELASFGLELLYARRQRKLIGAAKPRHDDDAAPA